MMGPVQKIVDNLVQKCDECLVQKFTENLSTTRCEPFKNLCRKRGAFNFDFLECRALILEGLGSLNWNEINHFGL